jgi:hypothetical protein
MIFRLCQIMLRSLLGFAPLAVPCQYGSCILLMHAFELLRRCVVPCYQLYFVRVDQYAYWGM